MHRHPMRPCAVLFLYHNRLLALSRGFRSHLSCTTAGSRQQAAGSTAALLFSYGPSYQKFPIHYFVLSGSAAAVMVFLFMMLPYAFFVLMQSASNIMFALPAIVGCVWAAFAVTYVVKSLRFA